MDWIKVLKESAKRKQRARTLRAKGKTMQEIATIIGVTRQRVFQILKGL